MKKNNHSMKKPITILTILALLVLILPVAVMAKAGGFIPTLPSQASRNAAQALAKNEIKPVVPDVKDREDEDEDETETKTETKDVDVKDDDMKSEQAEFVAGRNEWAKSEGIGIPPGHANLLYKLWVMNGGDITGKTFAEIKGDLKALLDANRDALTGKLDVKGLMSSIHDKDPASGNEADTEEAGKTPKGNAISAAARAKVKNNSKNK